MPWPAHITAISSRLPDTETIQNKFYALYNSILIECFPPIQFTITPQWAAAGAVQFAIAYVVESLDLDSPDSPVFFLEIKPPTHLPSISARKDAENQVRSRVAQLARLVRTPKLYGVSAVGRHLSYYAYCKEGANVEPVAVSDSATAVVDTAPVRRGDTNIMEEEGRDKFMTVVEEVKQMVHDPGFLERRAQNG